MIKAFKISLKCLITPLFFPYIGYSFSKISSSEFPTKNINYIFRTTEQLTS